MKRACLAFLALALSSTAVAQPPPPRGPAEVLSRARETDVPTDAPPGAQASPMLPPGHPPTAGSGVDQAAARALRPPEVATSAPSTDIPVGEILVEVRDPSGAPAASAPVRLGLMGSGGQRSDKHATTDAEGIARFTGLETGAGQAYRVNVSHEGATYSSDPFRLDPDRGHRVGITRLPVTRDPDVLLQFLGGTFIEIKPDERLHIVQQTELINLGRSTYVFPEGGLEVDLPAGFIAFQSQDVMTDQRIVPNDDGFRIEGSLPPGRVQLTWAFDLPVVSSDMSFTQRVPFRTYRYVVISDGAEGMTLEVEGFPAAHEAEDGGRKHFATRIERSPSDPRWEQLSISLIGIPGPGPARYIATGAASLLLLLGLYLGLRRGGPDSAAVEARKRRQAELVAEAAALEEAFAKEEVGPAFHERRRRELVDELATLLAADKAAPRSVEAKRPSA